MILVFGGTKESHEFCDFLISNNKEFKLCVATDYAIQIFEAYNEHLLVGKMDKDMIKEFCMNNKVSLIIDLTHPYAYRISQNAIEASKELNITYYRYERKSTIDDLTDYIYYVPTHQVAIELALKISHNIFLTVGSNNAEIYAPYNSKADIYIRVLPKSDIIKKCEDLGFKNKNIIAMQGPFSKVLNKAMLTIANSKVLITKDTGDAGGFMDKLAACEELGIKVIVIQKPSIDYPNKFTDIKSIIDNLK